MDERLIGWLILLVGYFVYNAIKKANQNKKKKGIPAPPPAGAPNTPQQPQPQRSLEDIFSEVFGEQQAPPPPPPPPPPKPGRPKYESIEYSSPPVDSLPAEEGTSVFKKDLTQSGGIKKILKRKGNATGSKMPFTPRKAFLYKELLDRKYID